MTPKAISIVESLCANAVKSVTPLSGGCINETYKVVFHSGDAVFVKQCKKNRAQSLIREATMLEKIRSTGACRLPTIQGTGDGILILEWINDTDRKDAAFFARLGRQLARLHQTRGDSFGLYENNYIGHTPQINIPQTNNWIEFFIHNRLDFQMDLAKKNNRVNARFLALYSQLRQSIPDCLSESDEPPTLIHGDLWAGNVLCDEFCRPVLIDPAGYFGHREMELSMTYLFGGFHDEFYRAYQNEYPMRKNYARRIKLYMLYHLLNHLNLFGNAYYRQTLRHMEECRADLTAS